MLVLCFGCCCGGWSACAWGEHAVGAFFLLLFSALCIAFLALIICGEVKLSFAVLLQQNTSGGKSESQVFCAFGLSGCACHTRRRSMYYLWLRNFFSL